MDKQSLLVTAVALLTLSMMFYLGSSPVQNPLSGDSASAAIGYGRYSSVNRAPTNYQRTSPSASSTPTASQRQCPGGYYCNCNYQACRSEFQCVRMSAGAYGASHCCPKPGTALYNNPMYRCPNT